MLAAAAEAIIIASSPGRYFANIITAGEKYSLVLIVYTCALF